MSLAPLLPRPGCRELLANGEVKPRVDCSACLVDLPVPVLGIGVMNEAIAAGIQSMLDGPLVTAIVEPLQQAGAGLGSNVVEDDGSGVAQGIEHVGNLGIFRSSARRDHSPERGGLGWRRLGDRT
jgi:hypothetical protein